MNFGTEEKFRGARFLLIGRSTMGAVYGAVKNCVNVSERRIPLLASQQGGVDAPGKKNVAKPP
jgi:hypothetical protein